MDRESFIFYSSFYEAIKDLDNTDFTLTMKAICEYALYGNESELSGIPKVVFSLVKPQVDANIERRLNGQKGGRPKKTNGYDKEKPTDKNKKTNGYDKEKPTDKNKKTNGYDKEKPNVNDNVNVNVNDNVNDDYICKSSSALPLFISLFEINPDVSSMSIAKDLDFSKVIKAFAESKWLKDEMKSLKWVVNNYHKIINGEYKDRPRKEQSEKERYEEALAKKLAWAEQKDREDEERRRANGNQTS